MLFKEYCFKKFLVAQFSPYFKIYFNLNAGYLFWRYWAPWSQGCLSASSALSRSPGLTTRSWLTWIDQEVKYSICSPESALIQNICHCPIYISSSKGPWDLVCSLTFRLNRTLSTLLGDCAKTIIILMCFGNEFFIQMAFRWNHEVWCSLHELCDYTTLQLCLDIKIATQCWPELCRLP